MKLPSGYVARPYRGQADHASMAEILGEYRRQKGNSDKPTVGDMDAAYAHLTDCDPDNDIVVIETSGDAGTSDVIGYGRTSHEDIEGGIRDCVVFAPTLPEHLSEPLFTALMQAQEEHLAEWAEQAVTARYRAYADHPGPNLPATREALWLEHRGYVATEWEASLVRPDLDDIPHRDLPEGVEVRPATDDQRREIFAAHDEAFRGEWDFIEPTEEMIESALADPVLQDISLWKIAWAGDTVVGQVKSYINHNENADAGYLRGYTEYISTHADWRNRGIAGALLTMSLAELRSRGMTQAALGADTNNPGGAFQLYTGLGFELQGYQAVYTKSIRRAL
jgi:mycothiol synthase